MDPLSIAVSCITLIRAIATTSKTITTFIRDVRDARSDLDLVSRELLSLETVLSLLADDVKSSAQGLPATLERQILGIIANCDRVIAEIDASLMKHGKSKLGKGGRWTVGGGKDNMARLRLTLEAHKSALDIALDMVSISIARDIKNDTEEIKEDTAAIRDDTAQILAEIARLQARLPVDDTEKNASNFLLQRYLDDLTSYAESEFESSVAGSVKTASSCTATELILGSDDDDDDEDEDEDEDEDDADTQLSCTLRNMNVFGNNPANGNDAVSGQSDIAPPTDSVDQFASGTQASHEKKQVQFRDQVEEWLSIDSESQDEKRSDVLLFLNLSCEQFLARDYLKSSANDYSDEAIVGFFTQYIVAALLLCELDGRIDIRPSNLQTFYLGIRLRTEKWAKHRPEDVARVSQLLKEDSGTRKIFRGLILMVKEIYQAPAQVRKEVAQVKVEDFERAEDSFHAKEKIVDSLLRIGRRVCFPDDDDSYDDGIRITPAERPGFTRKANRTRHEGAKRRGRDKRRISQDLPKAYTKLSARNRSPNCTVM